MSTPRPGTDPDPLRPVLYLGMLLVVYAIPLVVTLRPVGAPVLDPDLWWHLRVGEWVTEHRAVPAADPFSQEHRPWVAYSWLYEVGLYGLHAHLGLAGVVLYRAGMALLIVLALHRLVASREPHFLRAVGLTGAAVLALAMLFSERPWLFTVLFSILTLRAVLEAREGRRGPAYWALPVVFALWANIHIQFVYGLLILGLGCLAPLAARLRGPADPDGERSLRPLALLTAACLLATLLNPYHVHLYGVVAEYGTQPGPFRYVNELKALEFREPSDWVVLGLCATAVFTLGRRGGSLFDLLLLAAAASFTFRARRDLWFGTLAALAILTNRPGEGSPGPEGPGAGEGRFRLTPVLGGLLALGLLGVGLVTWRARDLTEARLEATVATRFPAGAAAFVRERGRAGPLYNDFNWGGYLIWALPELPVALDGRTNLHGDARIERFGATWSGQPGWERDPDLSAAGVVVADRATPLAELLRFDPRFERVYQDALAVVFVREVNAPGARVGSAGETTYGRGSA